MPARSIVRNVALFGRPITGPVRSSISSIENGPAASCSSTRKTAKMPMWFAMKPGVSFATTTPLPRRRSAKSRTRATTAGSVSGPGTSSSSRRYRGGLKK